MRLFLIQVGVVFALAVLPQASAQCCRRVCPKPKAVFQSQPAGLAIVARGTRVEAKPSGGAVSWNVAGAKPVRYEGLELKMISGSSQRRIATLNNQTFMAGESQRVNVRGSEVRVKCLEIRERSVLVEVAGEPASRELKMRAWQN